jgi:hypothetical protein
MRWTWKRLRGFSSLPTTPEQKLAGWHSVSELVDYFQPEQLVEWKLRVGKAEANKISREALKIGKRLDDLIRTGELPTKKDKPEVKKCFEAVDKWRNRCQPTLIFPERIDNEELKLTGQPDFYWVEADALIDMKSSKFISAGYYFQNGGYKRLGFPGSKIAVLRVDKKVGEYEYRTNEDLGISLPLCVDVFESIYKHVVVHKALAIKLGEI